MGEYEVSGDRISIKMSVFQKEGWSLQKSIRFECPLADAPQQITIHLLGLLSQYGLLARAEERTRMLTFKTRAPEAWRLNSLGYWEQNRHRQIPEDGQTGHLSIWNEYLEKAVSVDPNYAEAWNNLGWMQYIGENYEAAREAFEKAVSIKPELIDSVHGLGNAHEKLGAAETAAAYYQQSVMLNPSIVWQIANPFQFFKDTGQQATGIEILNAVISHLQKIWRLGPGIHVSLLEGGLFIPDKRIRTSHGGI